ncbi:MAG: hypothetical protein ACAF41_14780 [Leptolyngbya sp. BL-A-14]
MWNIQVTVERLQEALGLGNRLQTAMRLESSKFGSYVLTILIQICKLQHTIAIAANPPTFSRSHLLQGSFFKLLQT